MRDRGRPADRARILAAAQQLLAERGSPGAIPVDEIAARARTSKPALYRRFRSKEALFAELALSGVDVEPTVERRTLILDAALRVVAREGLNGATIARITAEAGGGRATIYAHFGDKAGLLVALVDRLAERLDLTTVVAGADPMDPERLFVEVARRGLATGTEQFELWDLLAKGATRRPEWAAGMHNRTARLWDPLVRYLGAAAAAGSVADGDQSLRVVAFVGMLLFVTRARRTASERPLLPDTDEAAREIGRLFLRGIAKTT